MNRSNDMITKEFVVYSQVKSVKKEDDKTWLQGSFSQINKEIAKGNKLSGISLETGKIGFSLSDKPEEVADEPVEIPVTKAEEPKIKKSRDGEILQDSDGTQWVIREIMVLKSADEVLPILAKKGKQSVAEIQKAVFVAGMSDLMSSVISEMSNSHEAKSKGFLKRFFS